MTAPASPADPSSFLEALGSCPPITLVQAAQCFLVRVDTDLATKLASLDQSVPRQADKDDEEARLRADAEKAKLPYKSVVSLYELHRIYQGLVDTCSQDARTKKTLEVLNSFSERHAPNVDITNPSLASCDLAKTVLGFGTDQKSSTKLDLSGRLLSSVPASLCRNFTNLISLDLSENQLKELPSSIGDLDRLEVLCLQSNQLTSLPDAIGFLENLKYLNVSGNMLVGLPDSIGCCRNLLELNAGFNQLQRLPMRIGFDMQSLQNLCVHSNKLTSLPGSIWELKHLKCLDLHFNSIKALPSSFGNITALEKLNISNNFSDFGGTLPDALSGLESLVELDLSFNQLRELPDCVGAMLNLRTLKIDNNPLVIPPPEIASQGTETIFEYMAMRWTTAQTYEGDVCTSPSSSTGLKSGFSIAACTGSPLIRWLSWKCGGRNTSQRGDAVHL